jgi:hypothetical protein
MGKENNLIFKTTEMKLTALKTLVKAKITELDPESLTGETEIERQNLKTAYLLTSILNDINHANDRENKKNILLTGTPNNSFCYRCNESTQTSYENQTSLCEKCGNTK